MRDTLESSCGPEGHKQILKIAPFHTGAENKRSLEKLLMYVRIIRCDTELLGTLQVGKFGELAKQVTKIFVEPYVFTKKPTTNKLASWLESRPREAPNNKPPRERFV